MSCWTRQTVYLRLQRRVCTWETKSRRHRTQIRRKTSNWRLQREYSILWTVMTFEAQSRPRWKICCSLTICTLRTSLSCNTSPWRCRYPWYGRGFEDSAETENSRTTWDRFQRRRIRRVQSKRPYPTEISLWTQRNGKA